MMAEFAKLISAATNYAVVQLPGRNFPGVVIQGDSLHSLLEQVSDIQKLTAKHRDQELTEEVSSLHELLRSVAHHFEQTCQREGIPLPY